MIELTSAEAMSLASHIIKIGRPHSPDDARDMEVWIRILTRGRQVDTHGADLLA